MSNINKILLWISVLITLWPINNFSQEILNQKIQVKNIKTVEPSWSSYNDIYDYFREYFFANNILNKEALNSGSSLSYTSPDCDPKIIEDKILKTTQEDKNIFVIFNEYFSRCGGQLSKDSLLGLTGLLRFASTSYSFFDNPKVKKVVIELSDNTLIPGILGLKDTITPRPFIVLKCGVFCDAGEGPSMRNYMMNFFDQSPFNVLLLANKTGLDYIKLNRKFTLGGEGEGPETMAVGRWLKEQSSFKDIISSLHMVGVSLGGNAAIFTSYYSDQIKDNKGEKIFKSVSAICPVLDLHDSMEHLYQDGVMSYVAEYATKQQLQNGKDYFDDIRDLLEQDPDKSEMKDYLGMLASESLTRRGHPTSVNQFWDANSFFKRMPATIDMPTLIFASEDDHIVNNPANTGRLKKMFNSFSKDQLGIVNVPYGDHCGFNSVYGMDITSTILRSFVLHQSPEYTVDHYKKVKVPWNFTKVKVKSYEINLNQTFEFKQNSNQVAIHFKVLNKWAGLGTCFFSSIYSPRPGCVIDKRISVAVADLQFLGARIPTNKTEAEALSREFDAKVQFLVNDIPMTGQAKTMDSISYRNW